jgi:hypothetical protein
MSNFALGQFRERKIAAIAREQRDHVGVHVETGAFGSYVVGDNQVGVLIF